MCHTIMDHSWDMFMSSHGSMHVTMHMHMSVHTAVQTSILMSMHWSMNMRIHMAMQMSMHMFMSMSIHMSMHMSIHMSMHAPAPMSEHMPMHLSMHRTTHKSGRMVGRVPILMPRRLPIRLNICPDDMHGPWMCLPECLSVHAYTEYILPPAYMSTLATIYTHAFHCAYTDSVDAARGALETALCAVRPTEPQDWLTIGAEQNGRWVDWHSGHEILARMVILKPASINTCAST